MTDILPDNVRPQGGNGRFIMTMEGFDYESLAEMTQVATGNSGAALGSANGRFGDNCVVLDPGDYIEFNFENPLGDADDYVVMQFYFYVDAVSLTGLVSWANWQHIGFTNGAWWGWNFGADSVNPLDRFLVQTPDEGINQDGQPANNYYQSAPIKPQTWHLCEHVIHSINNDGGAALYIDGKLVAYRVFQGDNLWDNANGQTADKFRIYGVANQSGPTRFDDVVVYRVNEDSAWRSDEGAVDWNIGNEGPLKGRAVLKRPHRIVAVTPASTNANTMTLTGAATAHQALQSQDGDTSYVEADAANEEVDFTLGTLGLPNDARVVGSRAMINGKDAAGGGIPLEVRYETQSELERTPAGWRYFILDFKGYYDGGRMTRYDSWRWTDAAGNDITPGGSGYVSKRLTVNGTILDVGNQEDVSGVWNGTNFTGYPVAYNTDGAVWVDVDEGTGNKVFPYGLATTADADQDDSHTYLGVWASNDDINYELIYENFALPRRHNLSSRYVWEFPWSIDADQEKTGQLALTAGAYETHKLMMTADSAFNWDQPIKVQYWNNGTVVRLRQTA